MKINATVTMGATLFAAMLFLLQPAAAETAAGAAPGIKFPVMTGKSLAGDPFRVPADFKKKFNLILVAFLREQQEIVDTWLPVLERVAASDPDFTYYEFPVLSEMNAFVRWWIYHGMRSGVKAEPARGRTVTFHLDKEKFKRHMQIADEGRVYLFLTDSRGAVLWQSTGKWRPETENRLRQALADRQ